MATLYQLLSAATLAVFLVQANFIQVENLQSLEARNTYYGGFQLNIPSDGTCPSGTITCSNLGGGPCCPSSDVCATSGNFCCPNSTDCAHMVIANPTCADPSWVMWSNNQTGIVDSENNLCCPAGWDIDAQTECAPPTATGLSAATTGYITKSRLYSPSDQATQSNDAQKASGSAEGSIMSATASITPTSRAPTETLAGSSSGSSSTQSATSSSATKSAGYKSLIANGSLALIVFLSLLVL